MIVKLKRQAALLLGLLLAAGTLALYWPALSCGFLNYDDNKYVTANPRVLAGLARENLGWAFQAGYGSNWHPLTWLSHMADCQLFGLNPTGHHLTNLLLHAANTLLLFWVLKRMTGALWRSAFVAALFAWHPAHVESVVWIAERKDVLSTFCFLATISAYAVYAEAQSPGLKPQPKRTGPRGPAADGAGPRGQRPSFHYALAVLFFALGLMSKPMLVTVPYVLLLLDYWPLRRFGAGNAAAAAKTVLLQKLPFLALSAVSCWITLVAQRRGGSVVPLTALSLDTRCLNALTAYLRYAGELVWPRHLTVIYPYVHQWPPGLIVAPLGFLVVVSGLGLWCRRQAPWVVVGWLWYLGTLVPVLGLVQVGDQPIADRYTYIPSIGLFILVAWTVPWLLARWSPRKPVLAAGAGLALAACALCTRAQLAYWQDSRALFEHAIAVTKDNAVAYHNLGLTFMERGQLDQALGCYQHTLELNPNYSPAHNNLGVALARLGRFDEAIAHYRSALELHPEDADVHYNLANALNPGFVETYARNQTENRSEWTDPAQARAQYEAALRLNPELVNAQINWANLELTEGNYQAAATHYRDALRLAPTDALAHFDLANVLVKLGRTNDAVASYSRAVELDPNNAVAHFRLANLLVLQGDAEGAATHYQRVVSLSPGNSFAGHELGSVLAKLGRFDEAAHWFGEAVRLNPDSAEAHLSLAKALVKSGRGDLAVAEFRAALKLQPDSVQALNNLAWVLATEPRPDVRDGAEAVKLALRACELTLYQEPVVLGTLDAAYAEAGQSEKAAEAARQTIELAQARGKTDLADKARARLRLYQARQPFREPGPSQQPTNP